MGNISRTVRARNATALRQLGSGPCRTGPPAVDVWAREAIGVLAVCLTLEGRAGQRRAFGREHHERAPILARTFWRAPFGAHLSPAPILARAFPPRRIPASIGKSARLARVCVSACARRSSRPPPAHRRPRPTRGDEADRAAPSRPPPSSRAGRVAQAADGPPRPPPEGGGSPQL